MWVFVVHILDRGCIDPQMRLEAIGNKCPQGSSSTTLLIHDDQVTPTAVASTSSGGREESSIFTSCMNFLQTGRMSLDKVAENIMACFSCGVILKISWTSRLISAKKKFQTYLECCKQIFHTANCNRNCIHNIHPNHPTAMSVYLAVPTFCHIRLR